ncbi:MAG TPA: hypothetical protein VJZ72_01040 [Candidatus Limnocylindrales bacterium]|nr:hypothetical protein [Candidatus Limnocylindrales bacterium]
MLMLGSGAVIPADATAGGSVAGEVVDGQEAANADALEYVAMHGGTVADALREFDLQAAAGALEGELSTHEAETFAGLWIEHSPSFRVAVLQTSVKPGILEAYIAGGPLEELVDVRLANSTLTDLRDDALAIRGGTNWAPYDIWIDIKANNTKVLVESLADFQSFATLQATVLPPNAEVVIVSRLAEPAADIYGGLHLGGNGCTSGFSVRRASPLADGITTAAHCGNSVTWQGVALPLQQEAQVDDYDVQWHTTPNFIDRNWIRWNEAGNIRSITGRVF